MAIKRVVTRIHASVRFVRRVSNVILAERL